MGEQKIRDYQLMYANSAATARSQIVSINECDGNTTNSQCKLSSQFVWHDSLNEYTSTSTSIDHYAGCQLITEDFNGDGMTDLFYRNDSGSCGGWDKDWIRYSTGNGFTGNTLGPRM